MLKIHPLYSSSSGNMFHIASSSANVLIDVGVSYKAVNDGLKSIDLTIQDIDAIFITHEHSDHIKAIPQLCKKNNIPIYAVKDTANYIRNWLKEQDISYSDIIDINYNDKIQIGDLEITAFETSHDAVMPAGYKITNGEKNLSFATDLGYISPTVYSNLSNSDYTILESNYDKTMLEFGKYPYPLKMRIKGITGHLSNEDCGQTIANLISEGQTRFLLAHMSENNNNLDIAKQTVDSVLLQNSIDPNSVEINFASKKLSNEEYIIC